MCHRLGRERDGVLGVEAAGNFEAWRYASTSTRFVPSRTERLRYSGLGFFVGVLFSGIFFLFGYDGFRGTIVVSRGVSALNLCVPPARGRIPARPESAAGSAEGLCAAAPSPSPSKVAGRATSADSMPVSIRLAMSARVLSSRAGCALSPDMFRGRGPLRNSWSNHRTGARGKRFSKRRLTT
jgi:hypothetical protein